MNKWVRRMLDNNERAQFRGITDASQASSSKPNLAGTADPINNVNGYRESRRGTRICLLWAVGSTPMPSEVLEKKADVTWARATRP